MYAAGYGIRPLRSSRRSGGLAHAGRWLVVLVTCLAVSFLLAKAALGAGGVPGATVVVQPGDTLWAIAAAHYPSDDVRGRVADIERLNGLSSPTIEAGETLRLPG